MLGKGVLGLRDLLCLRFTMEQQERFVGVIVIAKDAESGGERVIESRLRISANEQRVFSDGPLQRPHAPELNTRLRSGNSGH